MGDLVTMKAILSVYSALFASLVLAPSLAFGKLPQGFKETRVVKGLSSPVTFAFAPD